MRQTLPRICTRCGTSFRVRPEQVRIGRGQYCSQECYHTDRKRPMVERFWSHVEKTDGCWLWQASTDRKGYGQFVANGKRCTASRVAWELTNGPIPDKLFVLHHCDNPLCVRPDHLFLGTNFDNVQDMMRKGRHRSLRGPDNPGYGKPGHGAKFNPDLVRAMRARHAQGGIMYRELAAEFGISTSSAWNIVNGKRYRYVPMEQVS